MEIVKHYRMESLFETLLLEINSFARQHSVFEQYTVLVPNPSVQNWLTQRITEESEICVGINFLSVNQFLNQVTSTAHSEKSLLTKRQINGLLQQLIPTIEADENRSFGPLPHWLNQQTAPESRARLCQNLADTFDAYQMFRPDWLDAWLSDTFMTEDPSSESWQAALWRQIVALAGEKYFLHRGQITDFLVQVITKESQAIQQKYPEVAVFGVNELDKQTRLQLQAVSEITQLTLFLHSPAKSLLPLEMSLEQANTSITNQQNWNEGNILLAAWGYQARELEFGLETLARVIDQGQNEDFALGSSLRTLQHRIVNNQQIKQLDLCSIDDSLQIVSHYSRAREVEGLYDFLLKQFEKASKNDTTLNPHDVLVLCPDIASYAPYIRATFEHPFNQTNIPYQICGLKHAGGGVSQLMANILALPQTRYRKSEILDVLFNRFVRLQLNLSDEDVGTIKHWFSAANAHWGLDHKTLRQAKLPDYEQYTLETALNRIILGLSVNNDLVAGVDKNLFGIEGVSPLQNDLLDKLAGFFQLLTQWRDFCLKDCGEEETHSLSEWLSLTRELTRFLVKTPKAEAGQLEQWHQLLGKLEVELTADTTEGSRTLGYANFMAHITSIIDDYQRSLGSYRFGKVNIGSFGSLKGIPADTIAILGLNETDFPRKPSINEFNLLTKNNRVGDRQPDYQDKDAFLSTLLNAGKTLYCSYVGQDIQNNKERIPSIMLRELMDFVVLSKDKNNKKQNMRSLQQPMHPFSGRFNGQQSQFYTYRGYDRSARHAIDEQSKADHRDKTTTIPLEHQELPEWKIPERITIRELQAFLEDPVAAWYRNRLNIYMPDVPDYSADEEPFADSGLEAWKFKTDVINQSLKYGELSEHQKQHLIEHYIASAGLQHECKARENMEQWLETADNIVNKINDLRQDRIATVSNVDFDLELPTGTVNITGELVMFAKDKGGLLIHYDFKEGKTVKTKKLMAAILESRVAEHLKLHQQDFAYDGTWFVDGSADAKYQLQTGKESSTVGLKKILTLYQQAMQHPVALNIDIAPTIAELKADPQTDSNFSTLYDKYEEIIDEKLSDCSQALKRVISSQTAQRKAAELAQQFVFQKLGTRPESTAQQGSEDIGGQTADLWVKSEGEH